MHRPSFSVVAFVLSVLVCLGLASRAFRPYIPKVAENAMEQERDPFLRAGRLQPIPWRRMSPEALAEAERLDRPLLLFVGTVLSGTARQFDTALAETDVARLLARRFVCVRVDALEEPEWVNAFLPLSRMRLGFLPEAQVWFLDAQGNPMHFVGRASGDDPINGRMMGGEVREALKRFDMVRRGDTSLTLATVQGADERLLAEGAPNGRLNVAASRAAIGESMGREGMRPIRGSAIRFLLTTGEFGAARRELDRLLASPQRDRVEGGFFHLAVGGEVPFVEFDKWTTETAEMAHALALAASLTGDRGYAEAAKECLGALEGPLMGDRFLTAGEVGTVEDRNRSPRHSFPLRRLEGRLSADEQARLNLDPARNPQMIPFGPALPEDLLAKLSDDPPAVERAPEGYAKVHLAGLARALAAARLLGDGARVRRLSGRMDETWAFFSDPNGGVRHRWDSPEPGGRADQLAYADARLQDYLATGRYVSFQEGLRMMRRVRLEGTPEVADNLGESEMATAIRLLLAYGRLTEDRSVGAAFLREAYARIYRYGPILAEAGPAAAGFFAAAAEGVDDAYAVCVGPQRLADELARRCPTRLVAPAVGDVRRDLMRRGSGVYVIRGTVQGPISLDQAAKLLSPTLQTPD